MGAISRSSTGAPASAGDNAGSGNVGTPNEVAPSTIVAPSSGSKEEKAAPSPSAPGVDATAAASIENKAQAAQPSSSKRESDSGAQKHKAREREEHEFELADNFNDGLEAPINMDAPPEVIKKPAPDRKSDQKSGETGSTGARGDKSGAEAPKASTEESAGAGKATDKDGKAAEARAVEKSSGDSKGVVAPPAEDELGRDSKRERPRTEKARPTGRGGSKSSSSSGKDGKTKYTAYSRIVANVRGKANHNSIGEDPGLAGSSVLGGIKDRLFSFAGGETMDERRLRLRLDWYVT